MSNLNRQISTVSDELYDESNKGISRPPSLSRLYRDAAAYEQLLAQTNGDNRDSFAKSVDLDLTDAESVSSTLQMTQAPETLPKSAALATVLQEGVLSEIEPRKLVDLIIEEFGPLKGDEEERLIFEVDACLVSGVLVLVNAKRD
ncbi:hypothetical protein APHAL10511_002596 [Amanita phalloides]|nr:hypothetical protein APHAL10511_002596 [Amanita phalloides]